MIKIPKIYPEQSRRNKIIIFLGIILAVLLLPEISQALPPPGIFWRTNQNSDVAKYGGAWFLSGGRGEHFAWCEVEPSPGIYDFSAIKDYINKWKAHGKKAAIAISPASSAEGKSCPFEDGNPETDIIVSSPQWLFKPPYNAKFIDAPQKDEPDPLKRHYWPVYWDEVFVKRYNMMLQALVNYLDVENLLNDVVWIEPLHGRECATGVGRGGFYSDYIIAFQNDSKVAKDYDGDSDIDRDDFERFWTDFLKQSIDYTTAIINPKGLQGMLVIVDYDLPRIEPHHDLKPLLEEVTSHAIAKGMILGGKVVGVKASLMIKKPATHIIAAHPEIASALWNDFTSVSSPEEYEKFRTNYENAIGGVRDIPITHINYVYLASAKEVQFAVATWPNDCPSLPEPTNPQKLCYPEFEETIKWLLSKLEPVPEDTTPPAAPTGLTVQ